MQEKKQIVVNHKIIPELVSGSSTQVVEKQQASKTLKKFQGLSYFTTTHGFTLIELLVVVLIISILAAVAVPQYQKVVIKSRYATLKNLTKSLAQAQEVYYLSNGYYADDFDDLDVDGPFIGETYHPPAPYNYLFRKNTDFGYCDMDLLNARINCTNSSIEMDYIIRLHHASWGADTCICRVHNDDSSSVQADVCRMETRRGSASYTNNTFKYQQYEYDNPK